MLELKKIQEKIYNLLKDDLKVKDNIFDDPYELDTNNDKRHGLSLISYLLLVMLALAVTLVGGHNDDKAVDVNQYIYLSIDAESNLRCNVNSIIQHGSNTDSNYVISVTDSNKTIAENADDIKNSFANELNLSPSKKYVNYTNKDGDNIEILVANKLDSNKLSELNSYTKDNIRTVTQKKLYGNKYIVKSVISHNKDYDSTKLEIRKYSDRLICNQYIVLGNFRINLNNFMENSDIGIIFKDNILTVYNTSTEETLFNINDLVHSKIDIQNLLETKYDEIFLSKGYNKDKNIIAIKYENHLFIITCNNEETMNKLICNDDTMIDSIEPNKVQNVVKVKKQGDN